MLIRGMRSSTKFSSEKAKGRYNLEDLDVVGRVLKWILRN
jgi:hypothetical protein